MTDRQFDTTHAPGCWSWGQRHYECAVREIERLRDALEEVRSLSSIDLVMRSDQRELTAILGNIHHNADAALAKENNND